MINQIACIRHYQERIESKKGPGSVNLAKLIGFEGMNIHVFLVY